MAIHRFKHSFTSGELSPLMEGRVDFSRYNNGCKRLYNMVCTTQGPATRRPGLKFIVNLTDELGEEVTNIRLVPMIRSAVESFLLVFVESASYSRLYFVSKHQLAESSPGVAAYEDLPVNGSDAWDITNFDWAQSIDEVYLVQRTHPPYQLVYDGTSFTLSVIDYAAAGNNIPKSDGLGGSVDAWSDTLGWPERITFHQQRLVMAASLRYRDTIWMSASGEYFNHDHHSSYTTGPAIDADALSFQLASGTYNRIQWVSTGKSLHVGTYGDEWTVTGSEKQAITATSKLAQRQTSVGSEPFKPIMAGITTLFISRGGRTITEFVYDYTYDNYKTSDLSVLSPHLTDLYPIIDWAYQQTPDSIIWCVREDGALLGITYQRQHKVTGWHGHATAGRFNAVAAIPGQTREDDVYVAVERDVDTTGDGSTEKHMFIEVMADKFVTSKANEGRFLDAYTEYAVELPTVAP